MYVCMSYLSTFWNDETSKYFNIGIEYQLVTDILNYWLILCSTM
jgi:hypothetical protein